MHKKTDVVTATPPRFPLKQKLDPSHQTINFSSKKAKTSSDVTQEEINMLIFEYSTLERAFSLAKRILSPQRGKLSDERFEATNDSESVS